MKKKIRTITQNGSCAMRHICKNVNKKYCNPIPERFTHRGIMGEPEGRIDCSYFKKLEA